MVEDDSFDYRQEAENNSDQDYDKVLRPESLSDFTGQPSVVENLEKSGIVTGKHQPYRDWETDRKSTRLNSSHRL